MKTFQKIISGLFLWSLFSVLIGLGGRPEDGDIIRYILIGHLMSVFILILLWLVIKAIDCLKGE